MGKQNRIQRGMTLIELMIASGLMVMMASVLFGVALTATQLAANIDSGTGMFSKARAAFEAMHSDVARADMVLARYPVSGTAVYVASNTTTLILRIPRNDASGNLIPNTYDVSIYRLEPVAGRTGPNQLVRYKAAIISGAGSTARKERVLATNLNSIDLRYIGVDTFAGDGTRKTFTLKSTPMANSTVQSNQVMVGGIDRLADGQGSLTGSVITFKLAPKSRVSIDALYNADPAATVNVSGSNPASFVHITMRVRTIVRNAKSKETNRFIEMTSRSPVRNH